MERDIEQNIYIVGAHSRARTLGIYLIKLYPDIRIAAYLYDNEEPNPEEIDGIPVIHLDETAKLRTDWPVYMGTRGVYHNKLEGELRRMGMREIIPVTPEIDRKLRNFFLVNLFCRKGKGIPKAQ